MRNPGEQPIACALDATDAGARRARWGELATEAMTECGRTPDGARQLYRADPRIQRELEELIRLEAECCAFLEFTLTRDRDALVLEVQGPVEAAGILEQFASALPSLTRR